MGRPRVRDSHQFHCPHTRWCELHKALLVNHSATAMIQKWDPKGIPIYILAMPKCRVHECKWVFPKGQGFSPILFSGTDQSFLGTIQQSTKQHCSNKLILGTSGFLENYIIILPIHLIVIIAITLSSSCTSPRLKHKCSDSVHYWSPISTQWCRLCSQPLLFFSAVAIGINRRLR